VRCTAPDAAIPALRAEDAAFETRPRTAPSSAPAPHARPPPLVLTAATAAGPGRCAHGTPRKDDRHAPGLTRDAGRQTGVSGRSSPAPRVSLSGSARVWSSPRPTAPGPADRVCPGRPQQPGGRDFLARPGCGPRPGPPHRGRQTECVREVVTGPAGITFWLGPGAVLAPGPPRRGRQTECVREVVTGPAGITFWPGPGVVLAAGPPRPLPEGRRGDGRGARLPPRGPHPRHPRRHDGPGRPRTGGRRGPYDALLPPGAPGGRRGARAGPRRAPAAGHGPGRHRSRRAAGAAPAAGRHGAPGPPAP
jgi:hypothetical protein